MTTKDGPIVNKMDVGIPVRPFLWTLDQISTILNIDTVVLRRRGYIYYEGRSIGLPSRQLMVARNIAPADEKPEWRVAEREFLRWLRVKGFKYYDKGYIKG